MQKVLIVVLAIATIALAVLCAVQAKQLRAGRERILAVEELRVAQDEAQRAQESRVKELERANARLEKQVEKFATVTSALRSNEVRQASDLNAWAQQMRTASQPGTNQPGEGGAGVFGKDMGEMLGKMMKDPAMREMMREQQKAAINLMYAGMFKEMKLSPEEKERLKEILTDSQMKNVENAGGFFGGKDGAPEDMQKLTAEAKKQTEAEIRALLGEERFAYYEDYQKNMGERMQLDQFKTRLASENLTLQEPQTAQLLQIMKEEKAAVPPIIPQDNTEFPRKELLTAENLDKQAQWTEDYNRRVLARVEQVLTPEQFQQYRDFQEQQAAMQKLGLNMARQMFGGAKGNAPAPSPAR